MKRQWLKVGSLAAMDQAWLSGLNFAISLVFIRYGEKADYGLYVILTSAVLLFQGVQNALLASPFATIYPQCDEVDRPRTVSSLVSGQCVLILFSACLCALGVLAYDAWNGRYGEFKLPIAIALMVVGALAREATRAYRYCIGEAGQALAGDVVYGVVIIAGLTLMLVSGNLRLVEVLLVIGVAGVVPLIGRALSRERLALSCGTLFHAQFWRCGRWALVGVVASWFSLSFYPFVAGAAFGVSAAADLNAARLFLMPVMLAIPVWSNLMRPRFSRWFHESRHDVMRRVSRLSIISITAALTLYFALMAAGYPWLEGLLGEKYRHLGALVGAWSLVVLLSAVRGMLMANLMVDEAGYRFLSRVSMIGIAVFLPAIFAAAYARPLAIIYALAVVEALQLTLVAIRVGGYWKKVAHA